MSSHIRRQFLQGNNQTDQTYDSGPLGPLDSSFAESIGLHPEELPESLEDGVQRLEYYVQRLEEKQREVKEWRESAKAALPAALEKKGQSSQFVRDIIANRAMYKRDDIVEAFSQWSEDEQAYTRFKEEFDRLDYLVDHFGIPLLTARMSLYLVNTLNHQQQSERIPSQPIHQQATEIESEQFFTAQEVERQVLAANIEQRLRPSISNILQRLQITTAASSQDVSKVVSLVTDLQESLRHVLLETQVLVFELQPEIAEYGIAATLENYLHKLQNSRQIQIGMYIQNIRSRLSLSLERAMFRVAIESISNALLHSRADNYFVALRQYEDFIILTVEDDGIGFDVESVMVIASRNTHTGLGRLRLEADMLGTELGIESGPNQGTRIDYVIAL